MADKKTKVAVIFGGESVEHDVSVLTGLQFLDALDARKYDGIPVYVAADGSWWTGSALRSRASYPVDADAAGLVPVSLPIGRSTHLGTALITEKKGMLGSKKEEIPFDVMIPAIHGSHGEDGTLQGMLEFANIPYGGSNALASAATMDKDFTKNVLAKLGVPVLPHALIHRPKSGGFLDAETLTRELGVVNLPVIVKPQMLGSSVGVSRAETMEDLQAALLSVFKMDAAAVVEPFVPNLVEYNIATCRAFGELRLSAIERPLRDSELLDFKDKYLQGATGGPKLDGGEAQGMAAQTRELHPDLTDDQRETIQRSARTAAEALQLCGSCRIDFLSDSETGEIWFNEVNSIPGSFAYYLWEAADPQASFTELTAALVEEGLANHRARQADTDVSTGGSKIFARG